MTAADDTSPGDTRMTHHQRRPTLAWWTFALILMLPSMAAAGGRDGERCAPYVPFGPTEAELQRTGFHPGGVTPFLLGLLAGPRIALEWNDGRGVRTIELLRSVPYLGNAVGLFLCVEALSGYRMTAVAAETGIDDWQRGLYFQRIQTLEASGGFAEAARLRECSPFDTFNHPPDSAAIKPLERTGFAKWRSGIAGLLIDNRVGLEREESRGIRTIEYWTILKLPLLLPAIEAYRGRTMSEVVRAEGLDGVWRAAGTPAAPAAREETR